MKEQKQSTPIKVVGLQVRTTNEKAFEVIPAHWQKFYQDGILDKIQNKEGQDVYAVYTNFENEGVNNEGTYSFIIGAKVTDITQIPEGLVSTVIEPSNRKVFDVESNQPQKVGEKWQEIWGIAGLEKSFVSDYELYKENGEISVLVGIK